MLMLRMTREEYVDAVRPLMRLAISVALFSAQPREMTERYTLGCIDECYHAAELFLNKFEGQYKFAGN